MTYPQANIRRLWFSVALILLTAGPATAERSESSASPADQYRVLNWDDLVPEGWEPPLVAKGYDDVTAETVDKGAVVTDLDRQLSALPGYMKPVVYDGNAVTEFVLVPFLPHQVTAHAHLDPNQMVYVYTHEPVAVDNPLQPIWVVGAMSIEPVMTDEGPVAYRMVEAATTDYEF